MSKKTENRVIALTGPNIDLNYLGVLEDEGIFVIPVTGQELAFIAAQLDGDGAYQIAVEDLHA